MIVAQNIHLNHLKTHSHQSGFMYFPHGQSLKWNITMCGLSARLHSSRYLSSPSHLAVMDQCRVRLCVVTPTQDCSPDHLWWVWLWCKFTITHLKCWLYVLHQLWCIHGSSFDDFLSLLINVDGLLILNHTWLLWFLNAKNEAHND